MGTEENSSKVCHHLLSDDMSENPRSSQDVERGSQSRSERRMSRAERRLSRAQSVANDPRLDEYERLVKYVSVYREPGKEEVMDEDGEMKRVWYAPWKKRWVPAKKQDNGQQFPEDWLITDIHQGLGEEEVNTRRRRAGWNELVSQKENPIAKFISYFQGPILYGETPKVFNVSMPS